MILPEEIFLTKGVGRHREKLTSFELALRDAQIAPFNLVQISSIFPPGCKIIPRGEALKKMKPGQIVFAIKDQQSTNEPNRLIAASVGLAIAADRSQYGYLSEHHAYGEPEDKAGEYAEDLAAEMLASLLGVTEFDPDKSYDEIRDQWKISDKIVRTTNVTQSAVGDKNGLWTTVVAGALFTC